MYVQASVQKLVRHEAELVQQRVLWHVGEHNESGNPLDCEGGTAPHTTAEPLASTAGRGSADNGECHDEIQQGVG